MKEQLHIMLKDGQMHLRRSKLPHVMGLAWGAVFFSFWYYGLFDMAGRAGGIVPFVTSQPFIVLFLAAPLLGIKSFLRSTKAIATGDAWIFDKGTGEISNDGKVMSRFTEVAKLQIRRISNDDAADSFRLSLIEHSGRKHYLAMSTDARNILDTAERVADHVKVELSVKGRSIEMNELQR